MRRTMTRSLYIFEGEAMSEEKSQQPGDVLETRKLWSVQVREGSDYPWVDLGTHRDEAADILRIYDYRCENMPDTQSRIVRTNVTVSVEDPELLRENLPEEAQEVSSENLQSE